MEDKRLELIYEILIEGLPLTINNLTNYGYSEEEINIILKEEILKSKDSNEYRLYSTYELYYYGIRLLMTKEAKKANLCFLRCHQLEPNNRDFLLQLLLSALKLGNFREVNKLFSKMEKIESNKYKEDNNLYLYLISMLTSCPEEYIKRLEKIEYDHVLLPQDSTEYNKEQMNNIRHAIMKNKYEYALELLNTMMIKEPIKLVNEQLLKELLTQVITSEYKFQNQIVTFVQEQKYTNIVSFLYTRSRKRYLSNRETYIYLITKAIVQIQSTHIIPEVTVYNTRNLYEAIKGNNFKLARKINNKILRREQKSLENIIIDTLLKDINCLIYSLQEVKTYNTQVRGTLIETQQSVYHLQQENISLEDAQSNLTKEQLLLIKLVYAIDYYTNEMYLLGDTLLNEVEKSKDKTPRVNELLNQIRINKKFYKNRIDSYTRKRLPR